MKSIFKNKKKILRIIFENNSLIFYKTKFRCEILKYFYYIFKFLTMGLWHPWMVPNFLENFLKRMDIWDTRSPTCRYAGRYSKRENKGLLTLWPNKRMAINNLIAVRIGKWQWQRFRVLMSLVLFGWYEFKILRVILTVR